MSIHLSELCKGSEIEPILEYLKQVCPGRLSLEDENEDDDNNEEKKKITNPFLVCFNKELHQQMRYTFDGIWGYQDNDGRTALHWAIAMLNFSLANTLMKSPYNALVYSEDHDGASPFITACMVGANETFLKELLSIAAEQRRWKIMRDISKEKKEEEKEDVTTLGNENNNNNNNIEDNLNYNIDDIEEHKKAIVNQTDNNGNTPLLHAASRGKIIIIRFLLQLGASINHQNKRGQSALHRATSRGALDVVEELVVLSQKINNKLEHRRWINLQDFRGDTALFYASMDDNEELGRFLLRHGADRDIRNKEGKEFWEV